MLAYYDRYLDERLACAVADGCDFVFVNLFHRPAGSADDRLCGPPAVRPLGRRAGLDRHVRPHMVRHSTGTEMAEAGVPIDVVQVVLGHASITSTQVYVHPSQRRMRDAVEAVEELSRNRRRQRGKGDSR